MEAEVFPVVLDLNEGSSSAIEVLRDWQKYDQGSRRNGIIERECEGM